MIYIGAKTIGEMKDAAAELIDTHSGKFNEAFAKSDDGKLKISMSFEIAQSATAMKGVDLTASISYVMERIKDKTERLEINENQEVLNFAKA